jgi:hypothetical protein
VRRYQVAVQDADAVGGNEGLGDPHADAHGLLLVQMPALRVCV